jgi:formylglycine-generating enzyme
MARSEPRAMARGRRLPLASLALVLGFAGPDAAAGPVPTEAAYVPVPATTFTSVIESEPATKSVAIAAYSMRTEPVTNAQFLAFVGANPQWRRDRVPSVFAEGRYLGHWQGPAELGEQALPDQPVTRVSWFAAQAYCESEGARLPSWLEWERAASASATLEDARKDPAWRQQMLDWYAKPSRDALASVGGEANLFGVRDLHGLVWEWVDDFGAMMVTSDSRDQNDPDRLKFCGAAAMSLRDRDNYALLMRIAMLSSLQAVDTTNNLGFRCARDGAATP